MGVKRIGAEDAQESMGSGVLLVCAYENDEKFKGVHIKGAISLSEFMSKLAELPKGQEIIFY